MAKDPRQLRCLVPATDEGAFGLPRAVQMLVQELSGFHVLTSLDHVEQSYVVLAFLYESAPVLVGAILQQPAEPVYAL